MIHRLPEKEKWEVYNEITEEMDETEYLLSTKANEESMKEMLREYEAGVFEEHDLIDS